MKGHGTKYPLKREQAIAGLLTQPSIAEAAKTAGLSEATLWRWLKDEQFSKSYREAKRQVVEQAVSRLQQLSGEAANTLGQVMASPFARANTRLAAARVVLEKAMKALEMEDLASRVARLEKLIEKRHQDPLEARRNEQSQ